MVFFGLHCHISRNLLPFCKVEIRRRQKRTHCALSWTLDFVLARLLSFQIKTISIEKLQGALCIWKKKALGKLIVLPQLTQESARGTKTEQVDLRFIDRMVIVGYGGEVVLLLARLNCPMT